MVSEKKTLEYKPDNQGFDSTTLRFSNSNYKYYLYNGKLVISQFKPTQKTIDVLSLDEELVGWIINVGYNELKKHIEEEKEKNNEK